MTRIKDVYLQEEAIRSIRLRQSEQNKEQYFTVEVDYPYNMVSIAFEKDKDKALSFMEELSKKATIKEDDYIKGFKEGVEYTLKLREIK